MNRLLAWLWSFLPDKCARPGCARRGVRGNENIEDGVVTCDHCSVARQWENSQ